MADENGLSYKLGEKGDVIKCTDENNVTPLTLKVPVISDNQKKSEFDIYLTTEDVRPAALLLRMMNVNDCIQINGPHGGCKYLGEGNFLLDLNSKQTRNFKRCLILTENDYLSQFISVILSEALIKDEWLAMDQRIIYYIDDVDSGMKMATLAGLHGDNLVRTTIISPDERVERIVVPDTDSNKGYDEQIGFCTDFNEDLLQEMAPLPFADTLVMIKLSDTRLKTVNFLLGKLGFLESQILRF